MRKKFLIMLALPFLFTACSKSDKCPYTAPTKTAPAAEIANLKAWLDSSALPYDQHPSGIFYEVITPGSGNTANVCSNVTVKYRGGLTNGVGFDSSYVKYPDGIGFALGRLIIGWQIGIPLIKNGGSIILYVPPSLGYGDAANGPIPANSNLIFNIELVNVQ